jgi:anti-anti-sigma factor
MDQTPLAAPELKLETETTSDEVIVRCIGRMTYGSSEALRSRVLELVPEAKRLVLDFKKMTYLDSFGLGVLVSVYLTARREHRQLKLINVSQQAQQLLRITNLIYLLE